MNVEGPEFESMNHNDTVYLIPQENDKIDTLAREIKRIEVFRLIPHIQDRR